MCREIHPGGLIGTRKPGVVYQRPPRKPRPDRLCRHCVVRRATRARGLCTGCYHTPEVRELYKPAINYQRLGADYYGNRPCDEPTAALPGTSAKIEALAERAKGGVELWHPADAEWT